RRMARRRLFPAQSRAKSSRTGVGHVSRPARRVLGQQPDVPAFDVPDLQLARSPERQLRVPLCEGGFLGGRRSTAPAPPRLDPIDRRLLCWQRISKNAVGAIAKNPVLADCGAVVNHRPTRWTSDGAAPPLNQSISA